MTTQIFIKGDVLDYLFSLMGQMDILNFETNADSIERQSVDL